MNGGYSTVVRFDRQWLSRPQHCTGVDEAMRHRQRNVIALIAPGFHHGQNSSLARTRESHFEVSTRNVRAHRGKQPHTMGNDLSLFRMIKSVVMHHPAIQSSIDKICYQ